MEDGIQAAEFCEPVFNVDPPISGDLREVLVAYPGLGFGPCCDVLSAHGHFLELTSPFFLLFSILGVFETI